MTMTSSQALTPTDMVHLRRTIELASEAVEAGDEPFGSVLVDNRNPGTVLHEDRNRINSMGDATRHPEFELARWAAANMTPEARKMATMYTSGEHCAMCAAAHGYVGLGRIVYVASCQQLVRWQALFSREKGEEEKLQSPVAPHSIRDITPGVDVCGPVPELEEEILALHRRSAGL